MASVPSGPTAEGTRGAIVLTLAPHEDTFTSPSRRVSPRTPLFFYRHPSNATATRTVGCLSLRDYDVLRFTMLSLSLSLFSPRLNEIAVFFATRSVNFDPLPSNVLESKFFGSSLVSSSSCTISYYTINDFFLFLFFFFLLGPLEIPSILLTFPSGKKQSNSIVDCQV